MLHQTTSLENTSIRHRNNIEKTMWKNRRYFIDFESRIDVRLSTWNWCYLFHVDSSFIINEILTKFRLEILMSNRWRFDEDVSIEFYSSDRWNRFFVALVKICRLFWHLPLPLLYWTHPNCYNRIVMT